MAQGGHGGRPRASAAAAMPNALPHAASPWALEGAPVAEAGILAWLFRSSAFGLYPYDLLSEAWLSVVRAERYAGRALRLAEDPDVRLFAEAAHEHLEQALWKVEHATGSVYHQGLGNRSRKFAVMTPPVAVLAGSLALPLQREAAGHSGSSCRRARVHEHCVNNFL
uniref:Uncharacterized protein n=1 Tax=Alexandrium monilatum TaxID=311494 RepID=A0A7S4V495_9DINO